MCLHNDSKIFDVGADEIAQPDKRANCFMSVGGFAIFQLPSTYFCQVECLLESE
jgi:hypothetical protein